MLERFKTKLFWSMVITAVCTPLLAFLNGQMDLKAAGISALSGIIAGVLGILQPQPNTLKPDA